MRTTDTDKPATLASDVVELTRKYLADMRTGRLAPEAALLWYRFELDKLADVRWKLRR